MNVILDAGPEVYRLGFGDEQALDAIRAASAKNLFDLREQPGVRIGVVCRVALRLFKGNEGETLFLQQVKQVGEDR